MQHISADAIEPAPAQLGQLLIFGAEICIFTKRQTTECLFFLLFFRSNFWSTFRPCESERDSVQVWIRYRSSLSNNNKMACIDSSRYSNTSISFRCVLQTSACRGRRAEREERNKQIKKSACIAETEHTTHIWLS